VDARMTAGRIVLIFQQRLNLVPQVSAVLDDPAAFLTSPIPRRPIQLDRHNAPALLSCSAIYRSNMSDQDYRLTKVVAISASVLTETPKQAGFVGGGDQIYMSTENLYIAKVGKRWLPRSGAPGDQRSNAARTREMRDALVITQVGFSRDSGEIEILAQTDTAIRGRPKDQWAFKELTHNGTSLLGVFTTTGKIWSQAPEDLPNNYLWILRRSGSELPVVAKIADIARGETIRSLRYIGSWAYAVTFKKTDPLFAIDLSDPLAPKIVGELKIPGFSTYMHPVGPGQLIGIGFDVHEDTASSGAAAVKFQGIKLSLFDVSNPRDMRELDTMTFGGRGSYSDVTGDHHAFFYDAKLRRLAFPLTLLKGTSKTEEWQNKRRIGFAGAVLVQIGGSKLRQLAMWRHNRWIPLTCYQEMQKGRWWEAKTESQDVNRIYRIGEHYLTASRYGLKTYSVKTPQRTRQTLHFPGEFTDCGIGRDQN
jgi:inhibitor of cysteine peptidase